MAAAATAAAEKGDNREKEEALWIVMLAVAVCVFL